MNALREIASFARWRLVPVRYATRMMMLRPGSFHRPDKPVLPQSFAVSETGSAPGPHMPAQTLAALQAMYRPRAAIAPRPARKHPFVNLVTDDDLSNKNALTELVFAPELLDVAIDYFGGAVTLDSVQVLYSFPTSGQLAESQKWHLDYADTKSFHYIAYLNDVTDETDGPFVYVDRAATRKVGRSAIIRRIDDEQFVKELGTDEAQRFYGAAGSSIWVDPAACYHYGSRCTADTGRLAVFITFSSLMPFVGAQPQIVRNRSSLYEIGRKLRPDVDERTLQRLLKV